MSKLFIARCDISEIDFTLSSPSTNTWRITCNIEDPTGSYTASSVTLLDKIVMRGYTSDGFVVYDRYKISYIVSVSGKTLVADITYEVPTSPNTQYPGDPVPQIIGNTPITGSFPIGSDLSYKNLLRLPSTYQHLIDPDYMAGMDSLNFEQLIEPVDNILDWNINAYKAFASKKPTDPGYAYFYNDSWTDDYVPTFLNKLKLDGVLDLVEVKTMWASRISLLSDANVMFRDLSGDYLTIAIGGSARFKDGYATIFAENYAASLPILIGDYFARDASQNIVIDPDGKIFDIGLDTIHIGKGTASKVLALDVDKNIEYIDLPTISSLGGQAEITSVGALYGTGTSVSSVTLTAGQVMRRNLTDTGYEAFIPIPGGSIPSGTITGQMMWWDNTSSIWKMTNTSYVRYEDSTGKLYLGQGIVYGAPVNYYLHPNNSGSVLYHVELYRSANARGGGAVSLTYPDVSGNGGGSGNQLCLGRNGSLVDIVIGDGTPSGTPYIRFPWYTTAGILKNDTSGVISSIATSGSGTRFLREDATWQSISGGSPAGSNGDVQYNSSGSLGGNASFNWDNSSKRLYVLYNSTHHSYLYDQGIYMCAGSDSYLHAYSDSGSATISSTGTSAAMYPLNIACSNFIFNISATTPSSSSSAGTAGEIRFDSNYIYYCISSNTWRRSTLASW